MPTKKVLQPRRQRDTAAAVYKEQEAMGQVLNFLMTLPEINEAYTQAELELASEDVGWTNYSATRFNGEIPIQMRQTIVKRCRFYWHHDPLAKQAVRLWTDYSLGAEGFTVEIEGEDTAVPAPTAKKVKAALAKKNVKEAMRLLEAAVDADQTEDDDLQNQVDTFLQDPRNLRLTSARGQQRLSKKLLVDGELFFAIFGGEIIRTIDSLQIKGLIKNPDDDDETIAYVRQMPTGKILYYRDSRLDDERLKEFKSVQLEDKFSGKKITIDQFESDNNGEPVLVYHLPFDDLTDRGNSLLSSVVDWTMQQRKFMEARVAIVQALMKYGHKLSVKGGQSTVDAIRVRLQSTMHDTGSAATERNPKPAPGSSFIKNAGLDIDPMPRATGAGDAKNDGDQLKLMVCAGVGIMLHYFGDPSTGNLATATAMELPMLKQFGGYQRLWKDAWKDILSIALKLDPTKRQELDIDYSPIIEEDAQKFSALVSALTSAFPELKVDEVRKRALQVLGVEDIDQVMDEVTAQVEENKAQAQANSDAAITAMKLGQAATPANPQQMKQAAESYQALAEAIERMNEYSDDQARDEHGMWTSGGTGTAYIGHKTPGAAHTNFGRNTETHAHDVTSYQASQSKHYVQVDHDTHTNKVDISHSSRGRAVRGGIGAKGLSQDEAKTKLNSLGITHEFRK